MNWTDLVWTSETDSPSPAQPVAQSPDPPLFSAALRKLWESVRPDTSGPELLRAVVERPVWYAPSREGELLLESEHPGAYHLAIPSGEPQSIKKKTREGRGGRLLRLYSEKPEGDAEIVELSGRQLIRRLPEDADGLLLCIPGDAHRELPRDHFLALELLADACDLEDMLAFPGPDQSGRILSATFYVFKNPDGSLKTNSFSLDDECVVEVYTHPDRSSSFDYGILPIRGDELFRKVFEDETLDGIVVNYMSSLGPGENRPRGVALGPGLLHHLMRGVDYRPGAQPLPARTKNEVELWLKLRSFPQQDRKLIDAPLESGTLLRAYVPPGNKWQQQETLPGQFTNPDLTWSPVFRLADGNLEAPGYGDGPTEILCAGLLAEELDADSPGGEEARTYWAPGKFLLLGWKVDEFGQKRSEKRLAVARELAKLLPENTARLPRTAVLTVRGASMLRRRPAAAMREWIETTVHRAELFSHPWVLRT